MLEYLVSPRAEKESTESGMTLRFDMSPQCLVNQGRKEIPSSRAAVTAQTIHLDRRHPDSRVKTVSVTTFDTKVRVLSGK